MSRRRRTPKHKPIRATQKLKIELQALISYACYDHQDVLLSGKSMRQEDMRNRMYNLYMPAANKGNSDRLSIVEMFLKGKGRFKGLYEYFAKSNSASGSQHSKRVIPELFHNVRNTVYVVGESITLSLLTSKSFSEKRDLKPQRIFDHAKEVEANCKKALALCQGSGSPYKDFNGTFPFPSGKYWEDYIEWLRVEFYKKYEIDGADDNNIIDDDEKIETPIRINSDEESNDNVSGSKSVGNDGSRNTDDNDSTSKYTNRKSCTTEELLNEEDEDSDELPEETYFRGFFAFALWGFIPPPGFEDYKSVGMLQNLSIRESKKMNRLTCKKEEAERNELDAKLDRRGELKSDGKEKTITELLVVGRLENHLQQSYQVQSDNMKFRMAFLDGYMRELRDEFNMWDISEVEERKRIKTKLQQLRKEKGDCFEMWQIMSNREEERRAAVGDAWMDNIKGLDSKPSGDNSVKLEELTKTPTKPKGNNSAQNTPASTGRKNRTPASASISRKVLPEKEQLLPQEIMFSNEKEDSDSHDSILDVKYKPAKKAKAAEIVNVDEDVETSDSDENRNGGDDKEQSSPQKSIIEIITPTKEESVIIEKHNEEQIDAVGTNNEEKHCVADVSLSSMLGSKSADEQELNSFMNSIKKDDEKKQTIEGNKPKQNLNTTKDSIVDKDNLDEKEPSNEDHVLNDNNDNTTNNSEGHVPVNISDNTVKKNSKDKDNSKEKADEQNPEEGHDGNAVESPVKSNSNNRKTVKSNSNKRKSTATSSGVIKKRVVRKVTKSTKSSTNKSNVLPNSKTFQSPYNKGKKISPMKTRTGPVGKSSRRRHQK